MQKRFVEEWESTAGVDIVPAKALSGVKWEIDEDTDFALEMINKLAALRFERAVTAEPFSAASGSGSGSGSGSEVSSRSGSSFESQDTQRQFADYDEELFNDAQADLSTIKLLIWDLGGQSAFHCLHHLFMTSHGIYLLIFNLQRIASGSDEAIRHLEFWMHSLKLHAPGAPLVIAGTFSEEVDVKALLRCEKTISRIFRPLTSLVKIHKTSFYPIDNRTRKGTEFLREALHRAVQKQEQPRMEVPIKWLLCLNVISAMEDRLMYMDKVEALAKTYAGIGKVEVVDMLRYFHELGVILFFSNTSALRGIVTIHPQWLMDELVKVVRDHDVHRYDRVDIEKNGLKEDLQTFRLQGIVSRDLLSYFWGQRANYLIDLMRSLLLLSSWNFRGSNDELFLIPSMVHRRKAQIELSASSYGASFALHFEYIPDGVFERLVCLSVQYSSYLKSEHEPELNATACEVDFVKFGRITLVWEKNAVHCFMLHRLSAGQVVSIMQAMLKKVNEEFIGNALQWQVLCWVDKEKVGLEEAKKMNAAVWRPKQQASSGYHESFQGKDDSGDGEDRFDAFLSTF